ncbi:MAG TPA: LptE family protein [Methylomirabilota bacterium]|nr:LptE family protein [Methylomirabilota bacterium]
MADPARRARRVLGLALASLLLAGCGYSTRGNLPEHIKTVAVPIFKNRTLEPGVDTAITSGVVNAFSSGGRVRVVPLEEADAILEGEVVAYSLDGLAFDRSANVRAYRLRLVLNVEFRDVRRSALLWRQEGLQETSDFQVAGSVSDTVARGQGAVLQAASEIGRKVVNLAVDRF